MRGRVLPLLGFLVVVLALVAVLVTTPEAHGFRPVPGVRYPDLCRNHGPHAMPGRQTVAVFVLHRVRFVDPAQEPNRVGRRDCERVWRKR